MAGARRAVRKIDGDLLELIGEMAELGTGSAQRARRAAGGRSGCGQ